MKRRKNRCFAMIMLGMSIVLSGCNGTEQKDSQNWEEIMTEVVEAVSDEVGVTEHAELVGEIGLSMEGEAVSPVIVYTSIAELEPEQEVPLEQLNLENLSGFFLSTKIVEGDEVYNRINGRSYQENDDILLEELRYLKVLYYNYDNEIQVGEMIVNQKIERDCLEIFQELFEAEYPICRMVLIDNYWTGDSVETDAVSIKKNNTSSFNYRNIPGSTKRSNHALGLAVDLNPYENPYVPTQNGIPDYSSLDEQEYYYATNRNATIEHVITEEDLAYKLFTEHGFTWGGNWKSLKDYQHFEKK